MKSFKSKYFALRKFEFTKKEVEEAIGDLERFERNFKESLKRN